MITAASLQAFESAHRVLLRARDFIYFLPHPALRDQISNYTITFPGQCGMSNSYTVIPHGCATLVFSYDARGLHGNLFGPITKKCVVGSRANLCELLLIIEFQPAGFCAFTGIHQKDLTDQILPFARISPTMNRLVLEMLERTDDVGELVARLDGIFGEAQLLTSPPALRLAMDHILETTGNLSCKALSASVYYSQRHLNRMFEHHLGMNPKTFSRLIRIGRAIRLMQNPRHNLTCASFEAGFYDLPHFIHDFKAVCGITPQEYRCNMSDFYSEIAKY